MKIYSKTGDKGETSLVYGQRVSKQSLRVEAYGTCDEANSMIGMALSFLPHEDQWTELLEVFHIIQTKLFHVGAELSTPTGKKVKWPLVGEDVLYLEVQIDKIESVLPVLTNFLLPGGCPAGAILQVARTCVRRAERKAVAVQHREEVNPVVISYLNRLSDFLFVAARYVNHMLGAAEPSLHSR